MYKRPSIAIKPTEKKYIKENDHHFDKYKKEKGWQPGAKYEIVREWSRNPLFANHSVSDNRGKFRPHERQTYTESVGY